MFLSFRYAPHIQISNDYVAATIHCSIKTVTRATNKFHLDGFLLKQQPNQYAFNNYQFHPLTRKGKGSFNYWFNSLSPENQLSYKTDRSYVNHKGEKKFSLRNVPQNRITLVITKPIDERYLNARVREAEYLAGSSFTTADIMICFSLTTMRSFQPYDLTRCPNVVRYLGRIGARPADRRAMEKGDPGMALLLS